MPKQLSMQTLLDVIKALKIDVPIMNFEEDENGAVTIYLYGGEVKHWPPIGTAVVEGIRPGTHPNIDPPPPVVEGIRPGTHPNIDPPPPAYEYAKPPVTRSQLAAEKKARAKKVKP